MQRCLFLDNCRGFSRTWVSLEDVNFLVGENSAGKTSFLMLSRLLLGPKIFAEGIAGESARLGLFKEIVSAQSDNPTFFRIGMVQQEPSDDGADRISGLLYTFVQSEGVARISVVTAATSKRQVTLYFEDDSVYCTADDHSATTVAQMADCLENWCDGHSNTASERKKLDVPPGAASVPLMYVFSWLAHQQITEAAANKREPPETVFPPYFPQEVVWISPMRSKSKRTYDEHETVFSPEGRHSPYIIQKMLKSQHAARFNDFMGKVGKRSGLFEGIKVKPFDKDNPYGPFELDAVIGGLDLSLNSVGYGVSQSLPILVELLERHSNAWFAIQQPEVHLHPRAQAALGDVFFEAANEGKKFLIETHSDFTIDRFRMNYRSSKKSKKPTSQILFFERKNKQTLVTPIAIGQNGDVSDDQPSGYRKFFVREESRILGI